MILSQHEGQLSGFRIENVGVRWSVLVYVPNQYLPSGVDSYYVGHFDSEADAKEYVTDYVFLNLK